MSYVCSAFQCIFGGTIEPVLRSFRLQPDDMDGLAEIARHLAAGDHQPPNQTRALKWCIGLGMAQIARDKRTAAPIPEHLDERVSRFAAEAQRLANDLMRARGQPVKAAPKEGTKARLVFDMMSAPGGATNKALTEATGHVGGWTVDGRMFAKRFGLRFRVVDDGRQKRLCLEQEAAA